MGMIIRTFVACIGGCLVAYAFFGIGSGCLLISTHRSGGDFALVSGLIALVIGWLIIRTSGRKHCPECAEKVKYEAKKCKHCGSVFA